MVPPMRHLRMAASKRIRRNRRCCTQIQCQSKTYDDSRKQFLHAWFCALDDLQALLLRVVQGSTADHPDRKRRHIQAGLQIARDRVVLCRELAPRRIRDAGCVLAGRDEDGGQGVAEVAFLSDAQNPMESFSRASEHAATHGVRERAPGDDLDAFFSDDICPFSKKSRIGSSAVSVGLLFFNHAQAASVAKETMFCPAASPQVYRSTT